MCLFLAAVAGLRPIHTSTPAGGTAGDSKVSVRTKAIEDVQLGDRVLGENPESKVEDRGAAEPDPATWRELHLRAPKLDGSWADVKLLRPLSWLVEQQAKVGGTVEIMVPECGIEGHAEVLAIGPCPPVASGRGHVVTGTFRHGAVKTVDVQVAGSEKPIACTLNHPFWSEDRQEFVRADALRPNENLRTLKGLAQVMAVVPRAGPETVFNIEVQGEHVYQVGSQGVLVHNGKLCEPGTWVLRPFGWEQKGLELQGFLPGQVIYKDGKAWIKEYLIEKTHFDWFENGVLIDAKGKYSSVEGAFKDPRDAVKIVTGEAANQVRIATKYNLQLQWWVRKDELAMFQNILSESFPTIQLVPYGT
jgi:hypothetical protein